MPLVIIIRSYVILRKNKAKSELRRVKHQDVFPILPFNNEFILIMIFEILSSLNL